MTAPINPTVSGPSSSASQKLPVRETTAKAA